MRAWPIRRKPRKRDDAGPQSFVLSSDWRRPSVRWGLGTTHVVLLILLIIIGLGPILWLAKSALTPTLDTITSPMAWFPHGLTWSNLSSAWTNVDVGLYMRNTVVIALGSWAFQIVVATTGAYALSVLRPKYGKVIMALLLTTLFVPAVVLLVPLYVEVVHPPLIHTSFVNNYLAVWLPESASAFNVVLMKRFFDNLPREILEAARIDGCGPFRLFVSIVLPMSRPILGVVSIFAVIASWKDYLWPLLVLGNPNLQPLSVRLPNIEQFTPLGVFLAALALTCVVPIVGFLIFRRLIVRGSGLSGALKG
ncbi:MAG: carbohydrate transporter permease [Acidimicrobiaceae bacterium]|jgi:multiple sugar transport system permease protein|nr:carbohydrate transporter permease [Acidimicrobiaceae bacterium]